MSNQSTNTAARPSDANPECPTCETDLLVDGTNLPATYRCHGCGETFGQNRRPVKWDTPAAWYVSSNPRGRTRAHAERECADLARVENVLTWDAHNARAADLDRCKRCAYRKAEAQA